MGVVQEVSVNTERRLAGAAFAHENGDRGVEGDRRGVSKYLKVEWIARSTRGIFFRMDGYGIKMHAVSF